MRIISQDKKIDLPYEKTTLVASPAPNNCFKIYGYCNEREYDLAKYKTENKVFEIMENIRDNAKSNNAIYEMPY